MRPISIFGLVSGIAGVTILVVVTVLVLSSPNPESVHQSANNAAEAPTGPAEQQAAKRAEEAFNRMTPKEHLKAATMDFTADASESQLEDGEKNIEALKGSALERQGDALRTRYRAQKEREAKAETAKQAKEAAIAQEQAARQAESDLENERIQYAKIFENDLLDSNIDADVDAVGPRHSTLRVRWVLATKVFIYKFSKELLPLCIDDMRQREFKKLIITNGDEQWTWNL